MLVPFSLVTGTGVETAAGIILVLSILITAVWLRTFFR